MAALRPQRLGPVAPFGGLTLERRARADPGRRADRSPQAEWETVWTDPGKWKSATSKPLVIALVVVERVSAGSIAGNWIWQAGSRPHTAPQQSDGSATALPT